MGASGPECLLQLHAAGIRETDCKAVGASGPECTSAGVTLAMASADQPRPGSTSSSALMTHCYSVYCIVTFLFVVVGEIQCHNFCVTCVLSLLRGSHTLCIYPKGQTCARARARKHKQPSDSPGSRDADVSERARARARTPARPS
jgi:hypothetical protein